MKAKAHRNGAAAHTNGTATPVVRVAAYTRKSTDENLNLAFNSLDAQRDSIASYVTSQRGEGWILLDEHFDDGGFTGANTNRPALQRLIERVYVGAVDVVAVYKLDRLCRNMLDLLQLLAVLEEHGVSFLSVTQPFETRTPMGRFGLQMMGCVAELERAQISERIRDKMLASRRRGLWTGGHPPLGYDVVDSKLVVNEVEAERVRAIFRLYLEVGTLQGAVAELERRGWHHKSWTTKEGKDHRGASFTKSTVDAFLSNPLVVGRIRAGDEIVDGQHAAIVERGLFDAVKAQREKRERPGFMFRGKNESFLRGLVRCGACQGPMYPHYAQKGPQRRNYFVCHRIAHGLAERCPKSRVSAGQLEEFVVERIRAIGRDSALVKATVEAARTHANARRPELVDALRRAEKEERRFTTERQNLVDAIAKANGAKGTLTDKLEEVQQSLDGATKAAVGARAELALLETQTIDEKDLRRAVEAFDPVWDALFPAERSRIVHLLLEAVVVHGATGDAALSFRAAGIRALAHDAPVEAA